MSKSKSRLAPGTRVTCRYRPGHTGTVLADTDPRCWTGSMAFPNGVPTEAQVAEHLARCRVGEWQEQPVAWDFGKLYWDGQLVAVELGAILTDEVSAHG